MDGSARRFDRSDASALHTSYFPFGSSIDGSSLTFSRHRSRNFTEIGLSDNSSYWAQGSRALMVTDTALLRNPNYHLPTDTIETLDFDRMTRLCSQLFRTVRGTAKAMSWRAR